MIVLAAFILGACVTAVSTVVPHARANASSIEEFKSFQKTLSTLSASGKKH